MTFKKADTGKPRFRLIPPNSELEVAHVMTHGGDKYGDENWKNCNDWDRYIDALGRHLNAYRRGERYDHDTKRHHLAHLICCAMFIIEHDLAEDAAVMRDYPLYAVDPNTGKAQVVPVNGDGDDIEALLLSKNGHCRVCT